MIESVDFVMAALAAGATAGLTDTASQAVKDSYAALKARVTGALGGGDSAVVDELVGRPVERQQELREALVAAGADADPELVAAARTVLETADPQGAQAGKYVVDLRDSRGVQVGDHNTMTLNFNE
ncbi:hypothetical protein JOF56_010988 [Kibdelosporangium banguiense]|uniref:RHIM domain-containing protein n=1 Tax=Kibdelosporangium banguiense TaxID=1365924 RepID=A0ABS4U1R7_9PSEU|nr:RIP homotypic interaction motif-containing protein [Kibdelosporangium banguiense]MBP2330603.1 hypothetical protein [Kibdelosporangium banguiense]